VSHGCRVNLSIARRSIAFLHVAPPVILSVFRMISKKRMLRRGRLDQIPFYMFAHARRPYKRMRQVINVRLLRENSQAQGTGSKRMIFYIYVYLEKYCQGQKKMMFFFSKWGKAQPLH
jgi:hypothetical protein